MVVPSFSKEHEMAYKETQVDDRKWIVYTSDDDHNIADYLIPDYSVTTDKLAPNSITSQKLIDGAVTTSKLSNEAVTADKLNASVLDMINGNVKAFDTVSDMQAATLAVGEKTMKWLRLHETKEISREKHQR